MGIKDAGIELATNLDLSGAQGTDAYVFSPTGFDLAPAPLQNPIRDVGAGAELTMEFEVTETFTGYVTTSPFVIPMVMPFVAVSDTPTGASIGGSNTAILAMSGWSFTNLTEFGFVPSDTPGFGNLFKNDRFYVPIPAGVIGLPWVGSGTRSADIMPARRYLYAGWFLPVQTGQIIQFANPAFYGAANFTAGKMSARVLFGQPSAETGAHHYAPGMKVQ